MDLWMHSPYKVDFIAPGWGGWLICARLHLPDESCYMPPPLQAPSGTKFVIPQYAERVTESHYVATPGGYMSK